MYDLILRGGTVVDGKRSQPYAADICIREGRIARIAPEGGEEAREVVDVSGLAVAPGFIDIHTHSDACPLVDYEPESKLHQGITTEITGNCGTSILPSWECPAWRSTPGWWRTTAAPPTTASWWATAPCGGR